MDFLEIRKRAKAQRSTEPPPSPAKSPAATPQARPEVRTETARDALEAPGLPLPEKGQVRESVAPQKAPQVDPLLEFFFRSDEGAGELEELAAGLEPVPEVEDEVPREFLGFVLAGEEYAVELDWIREIVKVPTITEVPRAPAEIMGIMSLRGEVMPVFDLRRRLGLPPPAEGLSRRARVVIVDLGTGPAGVQVDGVHQVVRLKPSSIEPPPPGLGAGVESEYLSGIGRLKDRMYVLLNLRAVLSRPRSFAGDRR